MKNLFIISAAGLLLGSPAFSGGWEASRLDTSMMYNDGGYAEVSTTSISYDIMGTSNFGVKHKNAKIKLEHLLASKHNMETLILDFQHTTQELYN